MSQSDPLTDEDFAPITKRSVKYFNQFVTIYEHGCECAECGKSLSDKPGDLIVSCCPPMFDTIEEAREDAEDVYSDITGEVMADFLGTFEVEL